MTKPKLKFKQNFQQTEIVTKLKNLNCDKTQKLILWQNSKTQIGTKLKTEIVNKLKNSNCDSTQIVGKLKNSNCDNTFFSKKMLLLFFYKIFVTFFNKYVLTHWQPRHVFRAAFRSTRNVLYFSKTYQEASHKRMCY